MSLADRIAKILRQHVGRDNLISSLKIARRLGLHHRRAARDVRDAIALEDWREREMVVVAIAGAG